MNDRDPELQNLIDRQEILDCLAAYCRGVDRLDLDVLKQAYHPDAFENHAGVVVGTFDEFIEWVFGAYQINLIMSHHVIHNHTCELDKDTAHCETYCTYTEIRAVPPYSRRIGGRYIDRFERRNGRWGIAARVLVLDWIVKQPGMPAEAFSPERPLHRLPRRDRHDASYIRPLTVTEEG